VIDDSAPPDRVREQIEADARTVAYLDAEQNARVIARVRELAWKWDSATSLTTGQPNTVAKAFASELFCALAIHKTDSGDA
jgi:hypothetical protein